MKDFKKITNYFKPFLKKYKWHMIGAAAIFTVGNILSNTIVTLFYKNIINEATQQFSSGIYVLQPLLILMFWVGFLILISGIARRVATYWMAKFENDMTTDIHFFSFNRVLLQTNHFFSNNFTGTLVGKVSRMARNFRDMYETVLFGFYLLIVDIIVSVIILFREDTFIGFVFIGMTSFFFIFSIYLTKNKVKYELARAAEGSRRTGVISDIYTNILNVSIFAQSKHEQDYYQDVLNDLGEARIKSWWYLNHIRVAKNIVFLIFEVGIMVLAVYLFVEQKISIGSLVLIQAYTINIIMQSWNLDRSLTNFITQISETIDSIDVVTEPLLIKDPQYPQDPQMTRGNISLENINFTYPGGDHVFQDFSLSIPAGQSVGIVGKSGSGKTTITKLLLRFYDVDAGAVMIDGQDIRDVTQDDLRNAIAYIPQESILFHRSIKENIAYSKPGATDEEITQAALFAHADEFINGFEHGYNTKVGERGVKLSGGQRQRVAIARAMLKDQAPILIMDEATSSLDTLSEQYIQESFEKLMKNRTTIVIAHRLSTIQKMDRIIVLDKGIVVEDGKHEELLAQGGYYAELWNSQMDGFIE